MAAPLETAPVLLASAPNVRGRFCNYAALLEAEFLQERLRGISVHSRSEPDTLQVVGLALAAPGQVFDGPLRPRDAEELVQLRMHGMPKAGAYSVKLSQPCCCVEPFNIGYFGHHLRMRLFPLAAATLNEVLARQFSRPGPGGLLAAGRDIVVSWGFRFPSECPLVVVLPAPLATLVVRGAWSRIVLLGHWRSNHHIFRDWPPLNTAAADAADDVGSAIEHVTPARIRQIADNIRQRSELVLASAIDAEEQAGMEVELASDVSVLDLLADALEPRSSTTQRRLRHKAIELIATLRQAAFLKQRKGLLESLRGSIELTVPALLRPMFHARLTEPGVIPSEKSVRTARFIFDVAFAMYWRQRNDAAQSSARPSPIYLWADSSPQGGRNWLMIQTHELAHSTSVAGLAHAVDTLAAIDPNPAECGDGHDDESTTDSDRDEEGEADNDSGEFGLEIDDGDMFVPAPSGTACYARRKRLTRTVCRAFRWHCLPPVCLGSGRESLQDKCSALLHAMAHEASSMQSLGSNMDRVVAFCTDMGTELGLAGVVSGSGQCFAEWFQSAFSSQGQDGGLAEDRGDAGGDLEFLAGGLANADRTHLFQRALPIPGLLHILDNCTAEVHLKGMTHWSKFFTSLRAVCSIMCRMWVRERFLGRCLRARTKARSQAEARLDQNFQGVIEWRWGTLLAVLRWLLPLRGDLQTYWDPELFLGGQTVDEARMDHAGNEGVDVVAVTAAIRENWFWTYGEMLMKMEECLDRLRRWSESCICHRFCNLASLTRHQRRKRFLKLVGPGANTMFTECPMAGKLAPYMAAGQLHVELDRLHDQSLAELTQGAQHWLTEAELSACLADWHSGTAYVQRVLREKLAFWGVLPWLLAGVAHHDEATARRMAHSCLSQFASRPDSLYHHRVTNLFLAEASPLRPALVAFSVGIAPLADFPALASEVRALKWIPTVERAIEMRHSVVKGALGGKRRKHPTTVSLPNRLMEFIRLNELEPRTLQDVSTCFDQVRSGKSICHACRITEHPAIKPFMDTGAHHTYLLTPATKLFYRIDVGQQTEGRPDAKDAQERWAK